MDPVLIAALKGLGFVLAVGAVAGTAVYSQSNSLKLGLVAGVSASAAVVVRLLGPPGVQSAIDNARAAAKPPA